MLETYEINGTKHELLETKDLIKKEYFVPYAQYSGFTELGSNDEIGINASKVVIPPYISHYNSISSSYAFLSNIIWLYQNQILFYTNVTQYLGFVIVWYERA